MKKIITSKDAPAAIGPYSQAVEANGTLYISGQIPIDPSTGKLVEGGIAEQTERVLKNIEAILRAAGYTFDDVVKATCLLASISDFKEVRGVRSSWDASVINRFCSSTISAIGLSVLPAKKYPATADPPNIKRLIMISRKSSRCFVSIIISGSNITDG